MLKGIAAICLVIGLLSPIAHGALRNADGAHRVEHPDKVCITQVEVLDWLHAEPDAIPNARLRSRLTGPLAQQFGKTFSICWLRKLPTDLRRLLPFCCSSIKNWISVSPGEDSLSLGNSLKVLSGIYA